MKAWDPAVSRDQIEQALRESEARYSALFTHNYSVSLLIDPDTGRIVDANDAAARYYGYPRDRLTAMGIFDLNRLPEATVIRNLRRAKDEKAKHFFSTHYLADGLKRYVEVYSGPITVQGKPLFYSIIHDVTDRKLAETALQESQYFLSEAMDMAHMADWEFDVTTGTFTFNDRFYALYGTTAGREGGYRMTAENYAREFIPPEDRDLVAAEVRNAISTKDPFYLAQVEHRIIRRDGEIRHIIVRIRITKDRQGRTVKTHGANQDITERKQAEQELRESEERYRTVIEQIPDYILIHRRGTIVYVNPAAARQLGYALDELTGKTIMAFISPEYHETIQRMMARRMTGEAFEPYEAGIIAKNGSRHSVLINGALIQYMGELASLNVLTDITTLKTAEETIRKANELLEQRVAERTDALVKANVHLGEEVVARRKAEQEIGRSLSEKELLLREIHHRVKNNLQIIISLLNLQSRYIHDKNVLDAIQESQNRVRAMSLVHERIYRSHSIGTISLNDYIRYLVNQLFGFYSIQHSQIQARIAIGDIPVDIDMATPVGLIMNELITNSIRHAFPDGRKGVITIECTRPSEDTLRLVYRDNGTGLPPGYDWRTTGSLGLRLVTSLVDQLDGTIEREEGEGTIFIITIHEKTTKERPA